MNDSQLRTRLEGVRCEARFDTLTRCLYATDASIYQIDPLGVAFPRSTAETSAVLRAVGEAGIPIVPRGAGTGLYGGAIGKGLVIDLARYNRGITAFDPEQRTVWVEAGVVLDQLNDFLKPHRLCFGPDVATSSRATLGGMISNNSSGARAPIYGTTIDHVAAVETVLADGRVVVLGQDSESDLQRAVDDIADLHHAAIAERFPEVLVKRWPGYGLDRYLRDGRDLTRVLSGSEGTLGAFTRAKLQLVPVPKAKGLAVIFFTSVAEAMQATVDLLDLKPAAIENVDRVLFDQTKGQMPFKTTRALLRLDEELCNSFLIVEFYGESDGDIAERLNAVAQRPLGLRKLLLTQEADMAAVWALRKAGVSLLTGRKGSAKPIVGIEDVAVRPEQLPEYIAALQAVLSKMGLDASFYGHAASGLLHVRPLIDLHRAEDVAKYRRLTEEVSALVRRFKGSISAEHGVGIGRTEFMVEHLGPEVFEVMQAIKKVFDPAGVMNPGKIFDDGTSRVDRHLRISPDSAIRLPFEPMLAFGAKDESLVGNLEQCNGCGGCRKDTPTMCPTFVATGDESMSTRGRANTIRAALEGRLGDDPLSVAALYDVLGECLACKACSTECPSNVSMSLLKAELLYARQRRNGLSLVARMVSEVDLLGRLGCLTPRLANALLTNPVLRAAMEKTLGFAAQRPLPPYTIERFDRWFARRPKKESASRGRVILWDDTFVRYNEPNIGQAAVAVLEAAGYEVVLQQDRKCCGRPAFSVGRLDMARRLGSHNVALFARQQSDDPILFLEPSCYSMFAEDYAELRIPEAKEVAQRCFLFEQFIQSLLDHEPDALRFAPGAARVAIHAHCHTKAITDTSIQLRLAQRLPGSQAALLNTGCCGMAGAFGAMKSKYDLSRKVAEPMVALINALEPGTTLVASGTSCRHQIRHLTQVEPLHMAELLAKNLASPQSPSAPLITN